MTGHSFVFRLSYATLAPPTSTGLGVFSKHVACLSYCILSLYGNSQSQRTSRQKAKELVKTQEDSAKIFWMKITTHQEDIERCAVLSIHFLRTPSFPALKVVTPMTSVEGQSLNLETKASQK